MNNFLTRALTGAVYVILLVACTVYSPITSFLFFSIVSAATLWEFGSILNEHAGASIPRLLNSMAGFILAAAVWLVCVGSPSAHRMFGLYGLLLLYILIRELYARADNPLRNWTAAFASQLYIALPFALIPLLSLQHDADGQLQNQYIYPLALFVFLWTNDTGAYLTGSLLHRVFPAKLFPRISPNKSWVGSIGGGLISVAASCVFHFCYPATLPIEQWIGFALVVVIFGTWGDLIESLLKRQLAIKDSGHILPGHGGMLDRFDSSLLAIPAVVVYFLLLQA